MDRRYIMYFLLDNNENLTWQTTTDHVKIIVKKGNKEYLEWIDTCVKPMCYLLGAEGIMFI